MVSNTKGWEHGEALFREALAVYRAAYDSDHHETAHTLDMLGHCLNEQERFAEAADVLREAVEMMRNVLGPEHSWTKEAKAKLATALQGLNPE